MIFSNLQVGYRMVYTMLSNAMSVFLQNFHCILRPSISMDKRGHSSLASHTKAIHNHLISNDFLIHFSNTFSWFNTSFGYMSHHRRTALRNIILLYSFTLAFLLYLRFYSLVAWLLVTGTAKTSIPSCAS